MMFYSRFRRKIKELEHDRDRAECEKRQVEKKNSMLFADNQKLRCRNAQLADSVKKSTRNMIDACGERDEAIEKAAALEHELSTVKEKYDIERDEMKSELEKLRNERKGLFAGAAKLRKIIRLLEVNNAELGKQASAFMNNMKVLSDEVDTAHRDYIDLMKSYTEIKETNAFLAGRLKERENPEAEGQ